MKLNSNLLDFIKFVLLSLYFLTQCYTNLHIINPTCLKINYMKKNRPKSLTTRSLKNTCLADTVKLFFESTGASESLIDHVLRGLREDNKGILTEAYRLAVEEQKKKNSNSIKLDLLQKELNNSKA